MSDPSPQAALCADHPSPVKSTCARCGRFCCDACEKASPLPGHCAACATLISTEKVLGREPWRVLLAQLCMAAPVLGSAAFVAIAILLLRDGSGWRPVVGQAAFAVLGFLPFVASMSLAGVAVHGAAPDFAPYLYRRILLGVVVSTFFLLITVAALF